MTPSLQLTDEQLAALLEEHTRVQDPTEATPAAAPLKYRLGNQTFEAKTPEELQAQLDQAMQQIGSTVQALQAAKQQPQSAAPAAGAPEVPAIDKEKYARLFLENPLEAAEYLDSVRFGMARPSMAIRATMQDMANMEQSLAVQRFLSETEDYNATPENFATLQTYMQSYQLPWNYNGMQLAFKAAKADGVMAQQQAEEQHDQRFQQQFSRRGVPVVPRGSGQSSATVDADMMDKFESMSPDQMKAFLMKLPGGY